MENSTDEIDSRNIYMSMALMSINAESPRWVYGDRSQLTNWILDSGSTCHMTQGISDFITGSLVETYKYIEVSDWYFVTEKQRG